jgi:hypothetical protein
MKRVLSLVVALLFLAEAAAGVRAAEPTAGADETTYDLTARLHPGDAAKVTTTLDVGGELLLPAKPDADAAKLPLNVTAKFAYAEQILSWSADAAEGARSLRRYSDASATIKTDKSGVERSLPENRRLLVAELADDGAALHALASPLTREEFDLIDVEGNSLGIDRLLPGKSLRQGDGWDHDAAVIGRLLGMDHVAICEVRSVVTGEQNRQVQVRMAGTIHGTVDGAAAEIELRAAYLYHLDRGRITKLNLAVKQHTKPGDVTTGYDVVAKLSIVVDELAAAEKTAAFAAQELQRAAAMKRAELRELLVDAADRGYRFRHDKSWYVVAQQRELTSLRLMDEGEFLAHCNVTTAPPRPAGKPKTLAEFEKEVVTALGNKVEKVAAATEWTTPAGRQCLGVFVDGAVDEAPVQWRYYYLSGEGLPQATTSVTVEQGLLERFADADRPLVDSLELIALPTKTVRHPSDAAR